MLDMHITITNDGDMHAAAGLFSRLAAAFGSADAVLGSAGAAPVAEPAPRARRGKAAETVATDPAAAYVAAGGKLPADKPDAVAMYVAAGGKRPEEFAEEIAASRAEEAAPPALPSASFDEKCAKLRTLGRPHGVTWLRAVLKDNKVERISDLPESKIDDLISDLERAQTVAA